MSEDQLNYRIFYQLPVAMLIIEMIFVPFLIVRTYRNRYKYIEKILALPEAKFSKVMNSNRRLIKIWKINLLLFPILLVIMPFGIDFLEVNPLPMWLYTFSGFLIMGAYHKFTIWIIKTIQEKQKQQANLLPEL